MTSKSNFLIAAVAGALFVANAGATTVTATNYAAWKASLTGSPTEANFSPVSFANYNTSNGITLSGVGDPSTQFTFTGPDNGTYFLAGTSYNGIVALEGASDGLGDINVALSGSGQNAILISVASSNGSPITMTLSDGESFTLNSGLFGISISHPITLFSLSTLSGSQPIIDDLYYGASSLTQDSSSQGAQTPAPAAEGATLLMVAGGSLVLFGARRKLAPIFLN